MNQGLRFDFESIDGWAKECRQTFAKTLESLPPNYGERDRQPITKVQLGQDRKVTIDGKRGSWKVSPRHETMLRELVRAKIDGEPYVKGADLKTLHGCSGMNVSREISNIKKRVPPLKKLIKSDRQHGYYLDG